MNKQWTLTRAFQPAAVAAEETKILFKVKKGWRVMSGSCLPIARADVATTSTMAMGTNVVNEDMVLVNFLFSAIDLETMVPGVPIDGDGDYSRRHLYEADSVVYAQYSPGGGSVGLTRPKVRFSLLISDERY